MATARTLAFAGALAFAVVTLTGCTADSTTADPSSSPSAGVSSTPSTTPDSSAEGTPSTTPEPTESAAAPVVTIPTDCTQITDADTYAAQLTLAPLNPEAAPRRDGTPFGARTPEVPPTDADPVEIVDSAASIDCLWRDPGADITGLEVALGRLDQATSTSLLDQVAAAGATCTDEHDGRVCQVSTTTEPYGTDLTKTYFVRGDLVIYVSQSNYPTDDLLGSMLAHLES